MAIYPNYVIYQRAYNSWQKVYEFKIQNSVNIQHSQRVFEFFFFFRKVVGVGKWIEYDRVLQIVENWYVQKRGLILRLDMLFSMVHSFGFF